MKEYIEISKIKISIFFISIGLGLLFNYLFFNEILGINYIIFVMALLVSFVWLCRVSNISIDITFIYSVVVIIVLASSFMLNGNIMIRLFNFILIPMGILTLTLITVLEKIKIEYLFIQLGGAIGKIHLFFRSFFSGFKSKDESPKFRGVFIGILVSIPLLMIIISLMGSADEVFGYFMERIFDRFLNMDLLENFIQFFIISIVSSFMFAYVYQLSSCKEREENIKNSTKIKDSSTLPIKDRSTVYIANVTILIIVCVMYFVFSIVQFKYLFLGNIGNIPNFSYSQYARSGFFQMLMLTVISSCVIMYSRFNMRKGTNKTKLNSRILMTMLVFFNYILINSSFYRMNLYQNTFGYTMLRLYVYLALILEAIIMIIFIYGIWKENIPMIKWIVLVTITFYSGINLINMDAFIAQKNVDRYFQRGTIDVYYLTELSYDAYPQLERLLTSDNTIIVDQVLSEFRNSSLHHQKYNWKSYNYSRERAMDIINKY